MKFTELTVKEFENFVQNPSLESHYFQMKENIQTYRPWEVMYITQIEAQ